MPTIHHIVLCLTVLWGTLGYLSPALALDPGHVDWNEWSFDYYIKDHAGLTLQNVRFKGMKIIRKASVPVIRVRYAGNDCFGSPFMDQIQNDHSCSGEIGSPRCLLKINDCENNQFGNDWVCQQTFTSAGTEWLEMIVLARVGKYRIVQGWYLSRDGSIDARVNSRGVACPVDHDHHPYWRIDFDINGQKKNEVWVFEDDGPAEKVGNQWQFKKADPPHKLTVEQIGEKSKNFFPYAMNRRWFIKDPQSRQGVWVIPGPSDGQADDFAKSDIITRLYHSSEDVGWEFGAGGLQYDNDENIENDPVFWYVSHMSHEFGFGTPTGKHWLSSGPRLKINSPPSLKIIAPTDGEEVGFGGLNIVTFKASVSDIEDGAKCCLLTWASDKDGELGTTKEFNTAFTSPGTRVITATAADITGATSTASITLNAGNTPPGMQIIKPRQNATIFQGIPFQLEGTSHDPNEQFFKIPCSSLTWTSSKNTDPFPVTGCLKEITFTTLGTRTLTLTGKDSQGATGKDTVVVKVSTAPANSPPVVIIQSPINNLRPDPTKPLTLKGTATDPDGKSPLSYKWVLKRFNVRETILGTAPSISWKPRDNVNFHCGGESVTVCLLATDPDSQTGFACIGMTMDDPPC